MLEGFRDQILAAANAKKRVDICAHAFFGRRFRRAAAIVAIPVLALALAVPVLAETVVVDGKTYVALGNQVNIAGAVYELDEPHGENGAALVRMMNTNQYALLEPDGAQKSEIMLFPPLAKPPDIKNPDAVSGNNGVPQSLEPVRVYPIVGDLVVREGPKTAAKELAQLYAGQCVTKVGICGSWAILEWKGGIAYAFNAYLFEMPEVVPEYAPVTLYATEPVNVRALPCSREDSAVLYELSAGETVKCTGSIGNWSQIEFGNKKAYVFSEYLSEVVP